MDEQIINDKADQLIDFLKRKVRKAMPGIPEAQMWDVIIDIIHRAQEGFERTPSRQTLKTIERMHVITKKNSYQ